MFMKKNILNDGVLCHMTCASLAGFSAVCVGSPVDVIKTRMMNAPHGTYSGVFDCFNKIRRTSGLLGFYKGFIPNVARIAGFNIVVFMGLE